MNTPAQLFNQENTLTKLFVNTVEEKKIWMLHQMSYSSDNVLHSCPKKLQLYKLSANVSEDEQPGNLNFCFGHSVGAALQTLFLPGATRDDAYLAAFKYWDLD